MISAFTLNASLDRRYLANRVRLGVVNRMEECVCTPGGKGLNVARTLHALGRQVTAGGIVGGETGCRILRGLEEEGIPHLFTRVSGESRCCINLMEEDGRQTEFLEPGMTVTSEEYSRFLEDFDALAAESALLTLSGSLPRGLDADTYAELICRAARYGCRVLLDTSGAPLAAAVSAAPFCLKPNEREFFALTGCDCADAQAIASAACRLLEQGVGQVVVSIGARGALLACAQGVFFARPPRLKPANTVGCGDAMTAALAAAAERGFSPQDSLHYAVAVSAASALSPETGGLNLLHLARLSEIVTVSVIQNG